MRVIVVALRAVIAGSLRVVASDTVAAMQSQEVAPLDRASGYSGQRGIPAGGSGRTMAGSAVAESSLNKMRSMIEAGHFANASIEVLGPPSLGASSG